MADDIVKDSLQEAFGEQPEVSPAETPTAPEAAPASTTPEASGSAEAPSPAPTQPATPPVEDPAAAYQRQLAETNRIQAEGIQRLLEQNTAMLDAALKKAQPELSQAQRDEIIAKQFEELNQDPDAYVNARIEKALKARLGELEGKFAPNTPQLQRQAAIAQNIESLHRNDQGKVLRPELGDPKFLELMRSDEVAGEVYAKMYPGQPVDAVLKSREFYLDCYHEAKGRQAADFAKTKVQSETDLDSQRKVIQSNGTPPGSGGSVVGGGAKPPSEEAGFKAAMVASLSPMEAMMKGAKFESARAQPSR